MGGEVDAGADGFRDFVVARSPALTRTAYLMTGDTELAQELVREALTRLASRWPKTATSGDPEAWVRRILCRRAVGSRPAPAVAEAGSLQWALGRLTARERAVLVLRFFDDRTDAQAADALGCSVRAATALTRHALERLRQLAPELALSLHDDPPHDDPLHDDPLHDDPLHDDPLHDDPMEAGR